MKRVLCLLLLLVLATGACGQNPPATTMNSYEDETEAEITVGVDQE